MDLALSMDWTLGPRDGVCSRSLLLVGPLLGGVWRVISKWMARGSESSVSQPSARFVPGYRTIHVAAASSLALWPLALGLRASWTVRVYDLGHVSRSASGKGRAGA